MRRSYHEVGFVEHDGDTIGVCLGFDFCTEHEVGIRDLKKYFDVRSDERTAFGFVKPLLGLEARKINFVDEKSLVWLEKPKNNEAYLIFIPLVGVFDQEPEIFNRRIGSIVDGDLKFFKNDTDKVIITAWDQESFGIHVRGEEEVEKLRSIHKAFLNKDIAFVNLRSNNLFSNNGLCIVEVSKFPKDAAEKLKKSDQDRLNLFKTAKKSGIEQFLRGHGKNWYALSPKWAAEFSGSKETEYDVVFWLNPTKQHKYVSGWYSIEELKLWAQNRGPVMKTGNNF